MRLNMPAPRAMAALAACIFGLRRANRDAPEVRILVEIAPHIGMACFANHAAHVSLLRFLRKAHRTQQENEPGGS